jgi:hypothetical protein
MKTSRTQAKRISESKRLCGWRTAYDWLPLGFGSLAVPGAGLDSASLQKALYLAGSRAILSRDLANAHAAKGELGECFGGRHGLACNCRAGYCADGYWSACTRRHAPALALLLASSGQMDCQLARNSLRVTSPLVRCSNKTHIAGGTGLSPRIHWWTKLGAASSSLAICACECFSAYSCRFMREL